MVKDASADAIEGVLRRLSIPKHEVESLINKIRTDGWESYKVAAKKLGTAHHRAVLKIPKDSMKLLSRTHRLIANVRAVMSGPHRGSLKNIFNATFQRYVTDSIVGIGVSEFPSVAKCMRVN